MIQPEGSSLEEGEGGKSRKVVSENMNVMANQESLLYVSGGLVKRSRRRLSKGEAVPSSQGSICTIVEASTSPLKSSPKPQGANRGEEDH